MRKLEKHYKRVSWIPLGFALIWLVITNLIEVNESVVKIERWGFIILSLYALSVFFRIRKIKKNIETIKKVLDT